jgi:hypothetical protein
MCRAFYKENAVGTTIYGKKETTMKAIKSVESIPVIFSGGITEVEAAEKLLAAKKADLIGVGRTSFKTAIGQSGQLKPSVKQKITDMRENDETPPAESITCINVRDSLPGLARQSARSESGRRKT